MKFLVSTLNLSKNIREAIALNANRISVDYDRQIMNLYSYGEELDKLKRRADNLNALFSDIVFPKKENML